MDKKTPSLIGLSFDDGRIDNHATVWPLLRKIGMPATFNICTGYVLGDSACESFTTVAPMTPAMVRELFDDKTMEVAAHGHLHHSSAEDLQRGTDMLLDLLGTDHLTPDGNGIAVPHNRLNAAEQVALFPFMEARQIRYLRKSVRYGTHSHIGRWCRKMSRVVPLSTLYRLGHAGTLMTDREEYPFIYSVPILSDTPPSCVVSLIDMATEKGQHLVLQFHSIGGSDGKLSYPKAAFESLLAHMNLRREQGKIIIATTMQLANTIMSFSEFRP